MCCRVETTKSVRPAITHAHSTFPSTFNRRRTSIKTIILYTVKYSLVPFPDNV